MKLRIVASLFSGALLAALSPAQFTESEPNDSRATANAFSGFVLGSTLTGNSTSATTTGLDYFRISTAGAALGIYRHRLIITSSTVGHTGTLRGFTQTAAAAGTWPGPVGTPNLASDAQLQATSTTSVPPRFNQWYGFGKLETVNYRVTGTAATTADYVVNYEVQSVTPTHVGNFQPGSIAISTFSQGHTTDTDIWVYDSNLNAIAGYGNDDESVNGGSPGTGASLQSWLRRDYAPGRYYLALGRFETANNMGSPSDDDFRTGAMQEFANVISSSSTASNSNVAFAIIDSAGTNQFASTIAGPYDINWVSFDVVPEPASFAVLGLGAAALLRRRRGKK